jgi:hypothetical protein
MAKQVVGAYVAGDFDQEPWSIASDHVPYITVFEEPARESIQQKKSVLLQPSAHPPISQPLRERKRLNLIA